MSKFFTPIAVDVRAVTKLLPAGAFIEAVRWNPVAGQVEVVWDHRPFENGLDFPTEFLKEHLTGGTLPQYVKMREAKKKPGTEGSQGTNARTHEGKGVARARGRK